MFPGPGPADVWANGGIMNQLAVDLNEKITSANAEVFAMLSDLGKRIYFPSKGILSQSAEAKKLAKRFNATIGTAMENGVAMHLDSVMSSITGISANDALLYAPSPGLPALREAWQRKNQHDNPTLAGAPLSLPIVTNGLSHALSLVADLFINPGDTVIMPDMNWDNYHLNFYERCGAAIRYFKFFADRGEGLDLEAYRQAMAAARPGDKILVILNFPNNPSGYTPSSSEEEVLAAELLAAAERGVRVITLVDDAYFGLFFTADTSKQSFFTRIAGRHPRLLAIKADAATKEVYVWGLRVGFLTFSVGGAPTGSPLYAALEDKTAGLIRSTISNCSALSQSIILKALNHPDFFSQREAKSAEMATRAHRVRAVLDNPDFTPHFSAYPFNSGYFMCLKIKRHNANTLRLHLLNNYGIGTIAITDTNLRIAFSCLEAGDIAELFACVCQACRDLDGQNA